MFRPYLILLPLLLAGGQATHAQQSLPPGLAPDGEVVHYSFATLMGTGIYALEDRTITVFRMPLSRAFREPTPVKPGLRLRVPVAVGFHSFDPFEDLIPTEDQFATLSVVPGLEWSYLVGEHWRVAPSVYLGFGSDLSSSERSIIYGAGVSGLRRLPVARPEMHIGTAVVVNGYESNKSQGDFVSRWAGGIDAKFPMDRKIGTRSLFIGAHLIGYYYLNRLEFQTIVDEPIKLRSEIEFGIFAGARPAPTIFGVVIDRFGIGYRLSEVSDAVILFAGFPF